MGTIRVKEGIGLFGQPIYKEVTISHDELIVVEKGRNGVTLTIGTGEGKGMILSGEMAERHAANLGELGLLE